MGNMVWLDIETTGLDPEKDQILELAIVITDSDLNILSTYQTVVSPQYGYDRLMNDFVREMHTKSGLLAEIGRGDGLVPWDVVTEALRFLPDYVEPKKTPLSGSTISFDRSFLQVYMPELDKYFHYRSIDVSSIKELCSLWYPEIELPTKKEVHRAYADILESIELLKFFRETIFTQTGS